MADPKSYAGYVDSAYLALAVEHARHDKQQGAFFASLNHVLVAGRKPSDH